LIFYKTVSLDGSVAFVGGAAIVVQAWWSQVRMTMVSITRKLRQLIKYLIFNLSGSSNHNGSLSRPTPKVFILEPFVDISCISKEEEAKIPMADERLEELKAFVRFLKEQCGFTFNVNRFNHRIMLQKYVFLAKSMGWPNDYAYNLYIRGPYSPDLAKDYYSLDVPNNIDEGKTTIRFLDKERFAHAISGKNVAWLEVGTTMLSVYNNNKERIDGGKIAQFLLDRTKSIKSDYDEGGFIEQVLHDLVQCKLIRAN
jgi:uncharacterized protein YwgA